MGIKVLELLTSSIITKILNLNVVGVMPKRGCNTDRCEVMRFYKLHASKNLIEPLSMIVPRKVSIIM